MYDVVKTIKPRIKVSKRIKEMRKKRRRLLTHFVCMAQYKDPLLHVRIIKIVLKF